MDSLSSTGFRCVVDVATLVPALPGKPVTTVSGTRMRAYTLGAVVAANATVVVRPYGSCAGSPPI